jgi:hypothetical protein
VVETIRPETAVRAAKQWLAQVYADEPIERIGLGEVRFHDGRWEITLGFNRVDAPAPPADFLTSGSVLAKSALLAPANPLASALRSVEIQRRVYKVIVVDGSDNHVVEMRDREVA